MTEPPSCLARPFDAPTVLACSRTLGAAEQRLLCTLEELLLSETAWEAVALGTASNHEPRERVSESRGDCGFWSAGGQAH